MEITIFITRRRVLYFRCESTFTKPFTVDWDREFPPWDSSNSNFPLEPSALPTRFPILDFSFLIKI